MKESIIKNKSFEFALRILDLYKEMQDKKEYVLSKQILRSGTSIGANVVEALAGQTKKDFAYKMSIASKEARETLYWLELIDYAAIIENTKIKTLKNEIDSIIKILTSIVKTTQQNLTNNSKLKTQNPIKKSTKN